jgi:hypothetical protein
MPPDCIETDKPLPLQRPAVHVIRLQPIRESTRKTNECFHKLVKGTVWENYHLVATQWPNKAGRPSPGAGAANVTMETYVQRESCMRCHATTEKSRFVYFLESRVGTQRRKACDEYWQQVLRPASLPKKPGL